MANHSHIQALQNYFNYNLNDQYPKLFFLQRQKNCSSWKQLKEGKYPVNTNSMSFPLPLIVRLIIKYQDPMKSLLSSLNSFVHSSNAPQQSDKWNQIWNILANMNTATISLLLRPNKDQMLLTSYLPISLINVDINGTAEKH